MRANRYKWTGWGAFALLAGYLVLVAYPMVWVGYTSLKEDREIFRDPFALPSVSDLHWENYSKTWVEARFSQYFLNSLTVTTVSVAGVLLLGTMAAYALARFSFPGSQALFLLYMAGLMVPAQLSVIPLFFQMRDWGLLNTRTGLILVYIANGLPFAVFILTAFFRNLPGTLHEAARIDGCTEWQAFRRVMLPLARPGLITVAIFQFIGIWKEYFFAFMLLSGHGGENAQTLPLGLANLAITAQYQTDWGMAFAGLVLVIVPLLVFYLYLQKYLIRGIAAGALKG